MLINGSPSSFGSFISFHYKMPTTFHLTMYNRKHPIVINIIENTKGSWCKSICTYISKQMHLYMVYHGTNIITFAIFLCCSPSLLKYRLHYQFKRYNCVRAYCMVEQHPSSTCHTKIEGNGCMLGSRREKMTTKIRMWWLYALDFFHC